MALDSPVYIQPGFTAIIKILHKLEVIKLKEHRVSHLSLFTAAMRGPIVDPTWIPLSIVDTSARFIEILPRRNSEGL